MEGLHWWKEWLNIWFSGICQLNWGMHSCLCYYWIPGHLGILSAHNLSWKWNSAKGLRMMTELGQFQPHIVSHGPYYGKLQDSPAVAAWPSANVMDLRRQDSMFYVIWLWPAQTMVRVIKVAPMKMVEITQQLVIIGLSLNCLIKCIWGQRGQM